MSVMQPIEESRKTIASIVKDRIREAILSGGLEPGSRLDQTKLAADLHVSLVPVREALKALESEGFVRITPRRGAFVTANTQEDLEALYFARAMLEGEAAYHAAARLTKSDLKRLDKCMTEMNKAVKQQDYERFMHLNREFHFTIYERVNNPYLLSMILKLWDLAQRYRYRYMLLKDQGPVLQEEHQSILDACHAQDGAALREAVVFHMNQTLNGVRDHITHQP
jgi:DNA-binding GntR family transcriptional regulator